MLSPDVLLEVAVALVPTVVVVVMGLSVLAATVVAIVLRKDVVVSAATVPTVVVVVVAGALPETTQSDIVAHLTSTGAPNVAPTYASKGEHGAQFDSHRL